jgi:hypothetical protein
LEASPAKLLALKKQLKERRGQEAARDGNLVRS